MPITLLRTSVHLKGNSNWNLIRMRGPWFNFGPCCDAPCEILHVAPPPPPDARTLSGLVSTTLAMTLWLHQSVQIYARKEIRNPKTSHSGVRANCEHFRSFLKCGALGRFGWVGGWVVPSDKTLRWLVCLLFSSMLASGKLFCQRSVRFSKLGSVQIACFVGPLKPIVRLTFAFQVQRMMWLRRLFQQTSVLSANIKNRSCSYAVIVQVGSNCLDSSNGLVFCSHVKLTQGSFGARQELVCSGVVRNGSAVVTRELGNSQWRSPPPLEIGWVWWSLDLLRTSWSWSPSETQLRSGHWVTITRSCVLGVSRIMFFVSILFWHWLEIGLWSSWRKL